MNIDKDIVSNLELKFCKFNFVHIRNFFGLRIYLDIVILYESSFDYIKNLTKIGENLIILHCHLQTNKFSQVIKAIIFYDVHISKLIN